ncbi:MAG: hypothetical protein K9G46_03015 [Flavobacteriales bacterium]|jgi:hypothetical protein|nr:hypothetical protein [Flavobacteriales bacterium]
MNIERKENEIILRLPAELGTLGLQRVINYLRYREATMNSKASPTEADRLADESKARWWEENKHRFIK